MDWNDLQKYLEMTDSLWEHSIPPPPKRMRSIYTQVLIKWTMSAEIMT